MSQGALKLKIRFLGQNLWPVAREQTDKQTDNNLKTEDPSFSRFLLQPMIKMNGPINNMMT